MKNEQRIFVVLLGVLLLVDTIHGYRQRRQVQPLDLSLKTPVINALTERTAIDASWEQCMIVAPMTIQLLGQLLIVASSKDVSFRAFAPNQTYRYIRHPDSFRATLLQVSHEGYHAFLSGHSTMNSIQLKMVQIPKHIKTALKLLGGNFPKRVLTRLLPQILNNVKETGEDCVKLTNSTKNEFKQVMKLVEEVIQSTAATQSAHEGQVRLNEHELAVLQSQKQDLEKEEKARAQMYKEATDIANRAEDSYYKALSEIPTGWKAMLRDFSRGLLKIVHSVAESKAAFLNVFRGGGGGQSPTNINSIASMANIGGQQTPSFSFSQTLNMVDKFSNTLQSFANDLGTKHDDVHQLEGYGIAFRTFREFIASLPQNPAKDKTIQLISRSERLAAKALNDAKQTKSSNETDPRMTEELNQIFTELQSLQAAHQFADPKEAAGTISSVGQHSGDSSQNEVLKAQIAQKQLEAMRRRQDEQAAEYMKLLESMRHTNSKMIMLNLTSLNYKEIIEMLKEAFNLLDQVRTQWHHFVLFFTQMSQYIQEMVNGPLRRFLQVAGVGDELDLELRIRLIDTLKEDTFGIHRESYVLFVMSRTYYEVSSKYLMGRLAGLSGMLVARSELEKKALMQNLTSQTDNALTEIKNLIIQRKESFDHELNTRHTELTNLIDQLGGPNDQDQKTIEDGQRLLEADAHWSDY